MLDTFSKELYVHQCIFLHALGKSGLFLRVRRTSQHFFSAGGGGGTLKWNGLKKVDKRNLNLHVGAHMP